MSEVIAWPEVASEAYCVRPRKSLPETPKVLVRGVETLFVRFRDSVTPGLLLAGSAYVGVWTAWVVGACLAVTG